MSALAIGAALLQYVPDVIDAFKSDEKSTTEKLLSTGEKIIKSELGLDTATTEEIPEILKQNPKALVEFKKAVLADKHEYNRIALANTEDARNMQNVALAQKDKFAKRYVYYLATLWSAAAIAYIFLITLVEIPDNNVRLVDTITGFLLGTIVASIIQFFFGNSIGKKDEEDAKQEMNLLDKFIKK